MMGSVRRLGQADGGWRLWVVGMGGVGHCVGARWVLEMSFTVYIVSTIVDIWGVSRLVEGLVAPHLRRRRRVVGRRCCRALIQGTHPTCPPRCFGPESLHAPESSPNSTRPCSPMSALAATPTCCGIGDVPELAEADGRGGRA